MHDAEVAAYFVFFTQLPRTSSEAINHWLLLLNSMENKFKFKLIAALLRSFVETRVFSSYFLLPAELINFVMIKPWSIWSTFLSL